MTDLPMIEVLGFWLGIFLTFCILSFLYKDNPFYKFAEHLFIGVSIGYVIVQQVSNVLIPKLFDRLGDTTPWSVVPVPHWLLYGIALMLVLMMFIKSVSRRLAWVGRYPLAFVVAFYAGLQINGVVQGDLGQQLKRAAADVDVEKVNINTASEEKLAALPGISPTVARAIAERRARRPYDSMEQLEDLQGLTTSELDGLIVARRAPDAPVYRMWVAMDGLDARASVRDGEHFWFGVVSNILLLLGTLAALVYFYFSVAHRGVVGRISRAGVWVLMVGFGASFGYTVMSRISLAIGRAQYVLGYKDAAYDDSVHFQIATCVAIVVIVAGIAMWELRQRRRDDDDSPGEPGGPGASGASGVTTPS